MLLSNFVRWAGLAAVLAGGLSIINDLAILVFTLAQGAAGGLPFRAVVEWVTLVLLLLGLVGLYVFRSEALGDLGLVGFLAAFFATALTPTLSGRFVLTSSLGWIMFGAACLASRSYPRAAVILLIVGALLSGVVNALLVSGALTGSPVLLVVAVISEIIFSGAIGWLGLDLFTGRGEEAQRFGRVS